MQPVQKFQGHAYLTPSTHETHAFSLYPLSSLVDSIVLVLFVLCHLKNLLYCGKSCPTLPTILQPSSLNSFKPFPSFLSTLYESINIHNTSLHAQTGSKKILTKHRYSIKDLQVRKVHQPLHCKTLGCFQLIGRRLWQGHGSQQLKREDETDKMRQYSIPWRLHQHPQHHRHTWAQNKSTFMPKRKTVGLPTLTYLH